MISDECGRQVDNFIELEDLRDVIGPPPRETPERISDRPLASCGAKSGPKYQNIIWRGFDIDFADL